MRGFLQFLLPLLLICHCSCSLSSNRHHPRSSSSVSGASSLTSLSSSTMVVHVVVASSWAQSCSVSCVATSPACPGVTFATFLAIASLPPVYLCVFQLGPFPPPSPVSFACSFVQSLRCEVLDSPVSFLSRTFAVILRAIPIANGALAPTFFCLVVGTVDTLCLFVSFLERGMSMTTREQQCSDKTSHKS